MYNNNQRTIMRSSWLLCSQGRSDSDSLLLRLSASGPPHSHSSLLMADYDDTPCRAPPSPCFAGANRCCRPPAWSVMIE